LAGVTIPNSVTRIGDYAFASCLSLTNVTIPGSVTNIGQGTFAATGLAGVTILTGVTSIGNAAFWDCTNLTGVTIARSVTSIGDYAFQFCTSLTNITIPGSVTNIGNYAFSYCYGLQGVFFKGNAPSAGGFVFDATSGTVYYLPGTTGWGATFAGAPTRLWNPLMQSSGIGPAGFGFNITGTADIPIVIEAAANLAGSNWVPLQTLSLTNGAIYFSDPNWTNYPARFYRIRSP